MAIVFNANQNISFINRNNDSKSNLEVKNKLRISIDEFLSTIDLSILTQIDIELIEQSHQSC